MSSLVLSLRPILLDPSKPVRSLSRAFWLWKTLLFLVIIGCPGLGYDTSTSHLPLEDAGSFDVLSGDTRHTSLPLPLKFVRWDSIYFLHIGGSGYVFEQEWAFSYVYGKLVNLLAHVFFLSNIFSGAPSLAVAAVVLSHVAHYLSVLALYRLSLNIFGNDTAEKRFACFLSAALHIISPAGAFLSAPYGESLFSFLNITGFYIYSSSQVDYNLGKRTSSNTKLLLAATLFAGAITIRSNGILSGFLFAYDAVLQLLQIVSRGSLAEPAVRLCFTVAGGSIVALGLIIPQFLAYTMYCVNESTMRPWCHSLVPNIYGFVQAHYWGVGFLRYWTISNVPLFLLASPMLVILCLSGIWGLSTTAPYILHKPKDGANAATSPDSAPSLLPQLAIIQLLLSSMAVTSYHVQIINRISSGYPLWYWYIVWPAVDYWRNSRPTSKSNLRFPLLTQVMVIYALVQATLFGSFLPPA